MSPCAGPAGATCAETLRQNGYTGHIVMVCKEHYLPYDRPKLRWVSEGRNERDEREEKNRARGEREEREAVFCVFLHGIFFHNFYFFLLFFFLCYMQQTEEHSS